MSESFKALSRIILLFVLLLGFISVVGYLMFSKPVVDSNEFNNKYLLFQILVDISFISAIIVFVKLLKMRVGQSINIKTLEYKNFSLIILLALFFFVIDPMFLPQFFFEKIADGKVDLFVPSLPEPKTKADVYILFKTTLFAPIYEEVLYRGIIYNKLRKHFGVFLGILMSSILFSVGHLDWSSLLQFFVTGLILCYIYEKTKNLFYPIIFHSFGNVLVNFTLNKEVNLSDSFHLPLIIYVISLIGLVSCLYYIRFFNNKAI